MGISDKKIYTCPTRCVQRCENVDLFTKSQRKLINVQPTIRLLELLNNILLTLAKRFLPIAFNA